jgi:hypothetical protein
VAHHWYVSAFSLNAAPPLPGEQLRQAGTGTVRLSFVTERPFFPYREPHRDEDLTGWRRELRLFVVAPQRMQGRLEAGPWSGQVLYSDTGSASDLLGPLAKPMHVSEPCRMTAFYDEVGHRSEDGDLYFEPAADQSLLHPAPLPGGIMIPVDVIFLVVLPVVALVGVVRLRRGMRR